jgi:hypothetical protein
MKKIFISIAFLFSLLCTEIAVKAQTISRDVVAASGGTLTGGSNILTYSIGETVIASLSKRQHRNNAGL